MTREGWQVFYEPEQDTGEVRGPNGLELKIQFQHGPIGENGINGFQNEEIIEMLIMRMKALDLRMPCDENTEVIANLERAADWLAVRESKRKAQGVEGTERPHSSTEEKKNEG